MTLKNSDGRAAVRLNPMVASAASSVLLATAVTVLLAIGGCGNGEDTGLSSAAEKGNLAQAKRSVAQGADVNASSDTGTPLHQAALNGHTAVVRFLIEKGALVDAKIEESATAVFTKGYKSGLTLNESALPIDDRIKKAFGVTPLHLAIYGGHEDVVRLLIDKGANVNAVFTLGPDWKSHYLRNAVEVAEAKQRTKILELLKRKGAKDTAAESFQCDEADQ